MMKKSKQRGDLQLNLFMKVRDQARMVFRCKDLKYRINHIFQAKEFMTEMKCLGKSLVDGTTKEFFYELKGCKNKKWVLECEFLKGIVSLNLWEADKIADHLSAVFNWKGTIEDFKSAVRGMCIMADLAGIFRVYCK